MTEPSDGSKAADSLLDRFGIVETFASHLSLSLANMHPQQAAQAACQAVMQYVASYDFVQDSYKGADPNMPYRMKAKSPTQAVTKQAGLGGKIKMGGK